MFYIIRNVPYIDVELLDTIQNDGCMCLDAVDSHDSCT